MDIHLVRDYLWDLIGKSWDIVTVSNKFILISFRKVTQVGQREYHLPIEYSLVGNGEVLIRSGTKHKIFSLANPDASDKITEYLTNIVRFAPSYMAAGTTIEFDADIGMEVRTYQWDMHDIGHGHTVRLPMPSK
jgi:hypothetical protein